MGVCFCALKHALSLSIHRPHPWARSTGISVLFFSFLDVRSLHWIVSRAHSPAFQVSHSWPCTRGPALVAHECSYDVGKPGPYVWKTQDLRARYAWFIMSFNVVRSNFVHQVQSALVEKSRSGPRLSHVWTYLGNDDAARMIDL